MYKTTTNKMADLQEVKGGSGGNDYGMGNSTWERLLGFYMYKQILNSSQ